MLVLGKNKGNRAGLGEFGNSAGAFLLKGNTLSGNSERFIVPDVRVQ